MYVMMGVSAKNPTVQCTTSYPNLEVLSFISANHPGIPEHGRARSGSCVFLALDVTLEHSDPD